MRDQITAHLLRLLEAHTPADAKEASDVALIRQMIGAHPDIMRRTCAPGHITGSALVMDAEKGRVLLHYHKSLGKWLQFGGHTDDDETDPAQTALREAREESGLPDLAHWDGGDSPPPIDIDVHPIPASVKGPGHLHLDFRYLLRTAHPDALRPASDDESQEFRWIAPEESAKIVAADDKELLRLISKARIISQR
jgi:8-oxo-dGTP pyrophosphatase MutT (NUDIX family)